MFDLPPDLGAKVGRLLPRLASDAPGEVLATVAAIRRTLEAAGHDLHDLANYFDKPLAPVNTTPEAPRRHLGMADMAGWLRDHVQLPRRERDFVCWARQFLLDGGVLSPRQAGWLRDLFARHGGAR